MIEQKDVQDTPLIYAHVRHPHQPMNVNKLHQQQQQLSLNSRIAVWITKHVGTMLCAYFFCGIGIGSLIGVFTNNLVLALVCGAISSYFIQLVLLPVIMLGQNIQNKKDELQTEESFKTTQKIYHDTEQIAQHQEAHDQQLLEMKQVLKLVLKSLEQSRSRLVKSGTKAAQRESITQEIEAITQVPGTKV